MSRAADRYQVRVDPARQQLDVTLTLDGLDPAAPTDLLVTTWVPGAYGFMKYGRDVFDVRAEDEQGREVKIERRGWTGFRVEPVTGKLVVRWRALACDPSWGELAGIVTSDYGVLLATRYLTVVGDSVPCVVRYDLPEGWAIHHPGAGALQGGGGSAGFDPKDETSYDYASFAVLLDTPVVVGRFKRIERLVQGKSMHAVFVGRGYGGPAERGRFVDGLVAVLEAAHGVFGSFPFASYTFIFGTDPRYGWGLEHADSTMISLGLDALLDEDQRLGTFRVSAHEVVHAWNVCRLRPRGLERGALDWASGSFTEGLWVAEGFTRYYEFLLCVRARLMTPERLLSNVVRYFRALSELPAYQRVSGADSSLATFLNHNRYPGSANATIDYYDQGMLVAFDLDCALRARGRSLDEAFRALYDTYAGAAQGFTTEQAIETLSAGDAEIVTLLEREVRGTGGLSTRSALEGLGFELVDVEQAMIGVLLKDGTGPVVQSVLDDGPCADAGLAADDEILLIDGLSYTPRGLAWSIAHRASFRLDVRRGAEHRSLTVQPRRRRRPSALRWRGDATQLDALRNWLGRPELTLAPQQTLPSEYYDNFHGSDAVI